MPIQSIAFHQLGAFPYPYQTTGMGTALSIALYHGDPFLVFLSQTQFEDDLVYMHPETGRIMRTISSGNSNQVIDGMAYDTDLDGFWVTKGILGGPPDPQTIRLLDHDMTVLREFPQPVEKGFGIAVSGDNLLVSAAALPPPPGTPFDHQNDLYVLDKNSGAVLSRIEIETGHAAYGLSAFDGHAIVADTIDHSIWVLSPSGAIIAHCDSPPGSGPAIGPPFRGMQAIAADVLRDLQYMPQPLDCARGADSPEWQAGLCDPDLAWNPAPWGERNRIYIANESDQMIYVGYFTA